MLLRSAPAPWRSHEMSRAAAISRGLEPGDLVLGDRGFCSYAHLALLVGRGLHGVFRIHQKQLVDFTPGRPGARPGSRGGAGLPRSRWVLSQGGSDQVVVGCKPKKKPSWMTAEEHEALPDEVAVRELRYEVGAPGYRVRGITLVTTLRDAAAYPAAALAELYFRRWPVEVSFRHLKISMKMDVLRCETVESVLKELAVFALASNLVRSVIGESARLQGVAPDRIGFVDAARWLIGAEGDVPSVLVVNPSRRGRVEPRVKKRRPKQYSLMTRPRSELRKLLPMKGF